MMHSTTIVLDTAAFGSRPDLQRLPASESVRDAWLTAVVLGGQGYYSRARTALDVVDRRTRQIGDGVGASLSASTRASFLRQTGWHAAASAHDGRALALLGGLPSAPEVRAARCDALTGLAADALGCGRLRLGRRLLERCADEVDRVDADLVWRQSIRLSWVSAELSLASGDAERATGHAERAALLASRGSSVRHQVKSDLLRSAALTGKDSGDAVVLAKDVFERSRRLGLEPLAWAASMLVEGVSGVPTAPDSSELERRIVDRGGALRSTW
ncbi:hypothetical protein [Rhodococcus sp. 27YEA15]|uniref:hypothetical protein n=1 Tax=Rhodococcus sp. 27YEA15 TaxID=3156259 RepID=UPI003C7CEF58